MDTYTRWSDIQRGRNQSANLSEGGLNTSLWIPLNAKRSSNDFPLLLIYQFAESKLRAKIEQCNQLFLNWFECKITSDGANVSIKNVNQIQLNYVNYGVKVKVP